MDAGVVVAYLVLVPLIIAMGVAKFAVNTKIRRRIIRDAAERERSRD